VVSDEIHAPLVLPGATHTPYASVEGTAAHTTTLLSASKAYNLPGLKCAQMVAGTPAEARLLAGLPIVANHGLSPIGLEANVAAYERGGPWLDTALDHLAGNRDLFAGAVAEHLPLARTRRLDATYLAWVDLRGYGDENPGATALERGRVMVRDGRDFGPGGVGHVRLNIATSRARLAELVRRLGEAFDPSD
jgi:cystathionine beta-lyase